MVYTYKVYGLYLCKLGDGKKPLLFEVNIDGSLENFHFKKMKGSDEEFKELRVIVEKIDSDEPRKTEDTLYLFDRDIHIPDGFELYLHKPVYYSISKTDDPSNPFRTDYSEDDLLFFDSYDEMRLYYESL